MRFSFLALAVAVWVRGCGASDVVTPSAPDADGSGAATANATGNAGHEHPKRRPRGQPLPAFSGLSLENEKISAADLLGKRMLIYFFNPEVQQSAPVTAAVNAIAPLRGKHNFQIVGIATGSNHARAQEYVAEQGIELRGDLERVRVVQRVELRRSGRAG